MRNVLTLGFGYAMTRVARRAAGCGAPVEKVNALLTRGAAQDAALALALAEGRPANQRVIFTVVSCCCRWIPSTTVCPADVAW